MPYRPDRVPPRSSGHGRIRGDELHRRFGGTVISRRIIACGVPLLVIATMAAPAYAHPAAPHRPASAAAGATLVKVTAGKTTTVSAALSSAGSISGTISSAGNKPVANAFVEAIATGHSGFASTNSKGQYKITNLPPSTSGYAICIYADSASGGSSKTGYQDRCYRAVAWSGGAVPRAATRLKLATGQRRVGVNVTLPAAGAVSGKVVAARGGKGLRYATIFARNRSTGQTYVASTSSTGGYVLRGLPPAAKGYTVCFSGQGATGGSSTIGYLYQCYRNVAWNGGSVPRTARVITVRAAKTVVGVNGALGPAGAVAGKITDASNGKPIAYADVSVFTWNGQGVGFGFTATNGTYRASGMPAGAADKVCVQAYGYQGRCFVNVPWSGGRVPSSAAKVSVAAGKVHVGVNLKLPRAAVPSASIAGTVTEAAHGSALMFASVFAYTTRGVEITSTDTDASGHYTLSNLPANGTGYVVCADSNSSTSSTSPTVTAPTGWAPRCYKSANWNGGTLPGGTTRLPLTNGQHRTGINVALPLGGKIAGKVTAVAGGPVSTGVSIFDTRGVQVGFAYSDGTGAYSVTGLMAGSYKVCFSGYGSGGKSTTGYLGECYNNVPWGG